MNDMAQQVIVETPDGTVTLTADEIEAIEAEQERVRAERNDRLDALGRELAAKRRAAIQFRRQSGIEDMWREDDDAYNGIDDASRHANTNPYAQRPAGMAMPRVDDNRSTVVLNITKPYCNAFASKLISMRLQVIGRAWALKPTPVPELAQMAQSDKTVAVNGNTVKESDLAMQIMAQAVESAAKAQKRIDDWTIEGGFIREARQCVDDMARVGTGVLKGPMPERVKYRKVTDGGVQVIEKIRPATKCIPVDRVFPDPACGDDVHKGDFIFEFDQLTRKSIEDLKGQPGYLDDQIDAVLLEGPRPSDEVWTEDSSGKRSDRENLPFDVWYFTGQLRKPEVEAAGCECADENETVPVMLMMVNEHVIRMGTNPLDSGKFPYDVIPCSRVKGHWWGVGIARDLRTPQRLITGAARRWAENAGVSAGPQIVIREGLLSPHNGSYDVTSPKVWTVKHDADIQQVAHAFQVFQIDSRQRELMEMIRFYLKMCEDVTGLPAIMQGQQGEAPDVLGVVQILNANTNVVASRSAVMFDDNGIGPHIRRYYEWLQEYGEDESEKGDCEVVVLPPPDIGADAQFLKEALQMSLNPAFGINPKLIAAEIMKVNKFDPSRVSYTPEELQQMQEAAQKQSQNDPRIAVAQLNAQKDMQLAQMEQQFEASESAHEREFKLLIAGIDAELARAGLTSDQQKVLSEIKAKLGDTAIKIRAQREMQREAHAVQMSKPPVEPAGRAANGRAYTH
jgi:hypothetical protein